MVVLLMSENFWYNSNRGGDTVQQFSGSYYVHDGELYRKVLASKGQYKLKDKQGKYRYISMKKILEIIDTKNKK